MDAPMTVRRKLLLAAVVFGLAMGLIAVALKMDVLTTPKATASGPLTAVTFDDGVRLEVVGLSVGERVVDISPAKRFSVPFFSSKGASGGTYGGLNIDTEEEGGKVIRCRLRSDTRNAMLMEIRIRMGNGMPLKLPACLWNNGTVMEDDRISGKRGSIGFFKPKDDSVESLRDAMKKTGLQLLIQHRDPQGGWIHLNGPSMFHEPWPDRYIVALTAWQRNLPNLDFRAIRADGQIAEFSLANPDFRNAPLPGSTRTLPFVHVAGDFELTVKQVRRFATVGHHPFATVEMDVRHTGAPVPGLKDGPVRFDGAPNGAEDEWGNVVDFRSDTIRKKTTYGAFLPANSKRMDLNLTIVRTANYPRSVYAGFVVLEGIVGADGLTVAFTPGPDAALFGIRTMPVGSITPKSADSSKDPTHGWKQLAFDLSGGGDGRAQESIESRIGAIQGLQILVFPDNRNTSVGFPDSRSGGSGSGGGQFNFNRHFGWSAPPEHLGPGAKIRIGIQGPLRNEEVRFSLELPSLIQPR